MLRINIYSYKDYKDFVEMSDEIRGTGSADYWTLGKNDKHVFVYDTPNDRPDDLKKI
jgi:hypothetical protein